MNELLTKEKFISLLDEAKQDEHGHWYIEVDFYGDKIRWYFGFVKTLCDDLIKEYVYIPENNKENSYRYDRHFTSNDDTFEMFICKDIKE